MIKLILEIIHQKTLPMKVFEGLLLHLRVTIILKLLQELSY